ncbi:MAG TPA: twin-arginine translocase subunit TatC [Patescibacteria group bacterium]|nr:twin-arginine translocase subunit TatC [Patescibacteria group bacterium]
MVDADLPRERIGALVTTASSGSLAPRAEGPAPAPDAAVMPLFDHLAELRRRIAICLLAVGVGSLVGFVLGAQIIEVLKAPYGDAPLLLLAPGEGFFITLKIAIVVGVVLGMPVILFHLWRFISPGLTSEERRVARPWVPLALVFFVAGVAIAYVVLPFAIAFLSSFGTGDLPLQNAWTAGGYFGFVATMFLGFGLVMQYPIVLVLLSKVGIVTTARLRSSRRYVVIAFAIVAAVATPGGDIISPFVLGLTMYGLYELSIVLVRAGGR